MRELTSVCGNACLSSLPLPNMCENGNGMNSIMSPICNAAHGNPKHSGLLISYARRLKRTAYTHGPLVLPPGFSRSLPFKPLSINAWPTYGTAITAPTKARSENPILACKAGKAGRAGIVTAANIESGSMIGNNGCRMRASAIGGRVYSKRVGNG
jgi:hypothetical protein